MIDKGVELYWQVGATHFLLDVFEGRLEARKMRLLLGHSLGLPGDSLLCRVQLLLYKQLLLTLLLLLLLLLCTCLLQSTLHSLREDDQDIQGLICLLNLCL